MAEAHITATRQGLLRRIAPHMIAVALLLAGTFAVYGRTLGHSFLLNWDDIDYVVNNEAVHGFTWPHLREAFTRFYVGNYAPFQIVSYMADYTLWGLRPAGFLFTNVLLHALNGALFYLLLVRLSRRPVWGFLAAVIFLFHPVQVESVAWVSQRKNLLAMFFFLAAFHGYCAFRRERASRAIAWYVASCTSFVLALLAKAVAVVLPPALLLYDLCFLGKGERKGWLANKITYLLATAAVVALTLKSQASVIAEGAATFHTGGPLNTLYTMLTVLARYLHLLFWPAGLSAIYLPPVRFRIDAAVAWSALLAACLVVLGVVLYRRRRDLFFWYLLFFIGLVPVSQVVPLVTLMNDRYLYFPLLGGAAFLAGVVEPLFAGACSVRKGVAAALLCLVLLSLPWLSWRRAEVWRNDLTLWTDVVRKVPESTQAWLGYGMSSYEAGRTADALNAYLRALAIDPNYQFALNNIGALYNELGAPEKGRPYLVRATQLFPDYFDAYMNLGRGYYLAGDMKGAEEAYAKALGLQPGAPPALASLGDVYLASGRLDKAGDCYRRAAAVGGSNAGLEFQFACLEAASGRPHESLRHLEAALAMGYANVARVRTDPCLAPLRTLPEFQTLVQSLR